MCKLLYVYFIQNQRKYTFDSDEFNLYKLDLWKVLSLKHAK